MRRKAAIAHKQNKLNPMASPCNSLSDIHRMQEQRIVTVAYYSHAISLNILHGSETAIYLT